MKGRIALLAAAAAAGWGCVYYNGLWNAHRYAADARRDQRAGRADAAIMNWGLAAVEAESVVAHHPRSGWVPDALVTVAEGRAGAGDCGGATSFADRAAAVTADSALRERLALVRAECALAGGGPDAAEALARPVLRSKDAERRNRAALLAGRGARRSGAYDEAAALLAVSPERAAGVEEMLALIDGGRFARADTLAGALVRRRPLEEDWDSMFTAFARGAGAAAASRVVGRVVPRARLSTGARARLLLDDGFRLLQAGHPARADIRFVEAAKAAPDSAEADQAAVARLQARVAQLTGPDGLAAVDSALQPYAARGGAVTGARRLQQLLAQMMVPDTSPAGVLRKGELARDSLWAQPLAAALLLGFARRDSGSLFAPKAILAAIPLSPERADSLAQVLDARYAASPYTLALRGAPSPRFSAAEDSLARLFGIRSAPAPIAVRVTGQWAVPPTGPRGPLLDPPEGAPPRVPARVTVPGRRPGAERDTIN